MDALEAKLKSGNDVIVYIHGYKTTFANALQEAAALQNIHGAGSGKSTVIAFSWPSHGELSKYRGDQAAVRKSAQSLTSLLNELSRRLAAITGRGRRGKIHFFAQSMGNYMLRYGVQKMGTSRPTNPGEVILAAADEPTTSLATASMLKPLLSMSSRVSVYFNRNDVILKRNPRKLGVSGRAAASSNSSLASVDCTSVAGKGPLNGHRYFLLSRKVVADSRSVLDGVASNSISPSRKYDTRSKRYALQ